MTEKQKYKLSQIIKYFIVNTNKLSKTKLYKLLFFMDFEHIKAQGFSVTGLDYKALKYGPVPTDIMDDINDPLSNDVFKKQFNYIVDDNDNNYFVTKDEEVDTLVLTRNQLKIMERIAFIYKDVTAGEISDISHQREMPWEITKKEKGLNSKIDFHLALSKKSPFTKEEIEGNINLQRELFHYGDA